MIKQIFLTFFVYCMLGSAYAAAPRDPYKYFFQETWGDFPEEIATAREEGKKGILIFFEMDECPYCHYMKTKILNQPEVQDYYRKYFRIFSVDIEGDIEIVTPKGKHTTQKSFAFKDNRVRATPVFAFYDLDANKVFKFTGKTSSVKEFLWVGEYVVNQAYKTKNFREYKKERRKADK
jgi:thioredoxin-related protein